MALFVRIDLIDDYVHFQDISVSAIESMVIIIKSSKINSTQTKYNKSNERGSPF